MKRSLILLVLMLATNNNMSYMSFRNFTRDVSKVYENYDTFNRLTILSPRNSANHPMKLDREHQ